MKNRLSVTYVGGATALLEFGGLRWLTDPTFDPGGTEYESGPVTLRKLHSPAVTPERLGAFDYVLLSHDHQTIWITPGATFSQKQRTCSRRRKDRNAWVTTAWV